MQYTGWRKHSSKLLIFFIIKTLFFQGESYTLRCPSAAEWNLKANVTCSNRNQYYCLLCPTTDVYRCLWKTNGGYVEGCGGPVFDRKGHKKIIAGSFTREPCVENRYQPFVYYTNESSECVFEKSSCKQEGQVIFNNGSGETDRVCSCDLKKGYAYVNALHSQFCSPSGYEDCSCYSKSCDELQCLLPDYQITLENRTEPTNNIITKSFQNYLADLSISIIDIPGKRQNSRTTLTEIICITIVIYTFMTILILSGKLDVTISCDEINKYDSNVTEKMIDARKQCLQGKQTNDCVARNDRSGVEKIFTTCHTSLQMKEDGKSDLLSPEESNFPRFCHLIHKVAPQAVRHRFDQVFPPADLDEIIQKNMAVLQDLHSRRIITHLQWKLICPSGSAPVSSSFDVTLMLCLFRHLTNISPISGNYESLPPPSDVTLGADLARIKYYRKEIAHYSEKDRYIDNHEFSGVWEAVSKAVVRIGGPGYEQQCTTLLSTSLNSSYLEIYREFMELWSKQQERMKILESKKTELEIKLNDPISPIERGNSNIELEEWQAGDKKFIVTRASEHVLQSLKTTKCVTVTGSSGVGKTATIRHVALQMKEQGYAILPIQHPWDVIRSNDPNQRILYVIDNCCGRYYTSQMDFEDWEKEMDDIERLLDNSFSKIIIGCRLQVYNDKKFKTLSLFNIFECNLQSENLCLSNTERESLAKLYLKEKVPKGLIDNKSEFFPLLCSLSKEKLFLDIKKFFEKTFTVYESELDKMDLEGAHLKRCVLALVVMFNNKLREDWLTEDIEEGMQSVIEKTCEACKVNKGTSRLVLRDELDSLTNTYLQKHNNVYSTIHDKLFDFLGYYFGKHIAACLIQNADSYFVRERFFYVQQEERDDYMIVIPEKYQQMFIDRLVKDWSQDEIVNVFSNINMKCIQFREQFLSHIKTLPLIDQHMFAKRIDKHAGETILFRNCYHGYADIVSWCFGTNVDVNTCRPDGVSPLTAACFEGHTRIVDLLLKNNADIVKSSNRGISPLFVACQNGHTEIVRLLFNHYAYILQRRNYGVLNSFQGFANLTPNKTTYVNKFTNDGVSPLYIACQNGHTEIVYMLLNDSADVNKCQNDGVSPLLIACENGYTEIVSMLLDHNADVNKCKNNGVSPLLIACGNGYTEIVSMLLDHNTDVSKCKNDGNDGKTPLYMACLKGHIKVSLKTKSDVNKYRNSGTSPLFVACLNGHTEIVKILLSHNADVNKCESGGTSPLYIACQEGHTEIVKILVNKNADVNKCDNNGTSPLHMACQKGQREIIEILLNHNADVNKCDIMGISPLCIASFTGQTDIVHTLLKRNADVNMCDNNGIAPLCVACENGHTQIVDMLLSHNAEINKCTNEGKSPLFWACQNGHLEIVSKLVATQADINKCWDIGESPLFVACQMGHTDIVHKLLNANADINTSMKTEASPLFIACQNGHNNIVNLLLDHNADVNKCRNDGASPLYIACGKGNKEIVSKLINENADISKCTNKKNSPLSIACENGHKEIVNM